MEKDVNTKGNYFQTQLAKWYVRIIVFGILAGICYSVFSKIGGYTGFGLGLMLTVLIPSVAIESARINSSPLLFGLKFSPRAFFDVFFGLGIALADIAVIAGIARCFTGEIKFSIPDGNLLIMLAISTLFLAVFEEILFRGVIFQAVQEKFGDILCVILMSAAFAFAHFFGGNMSGIFFLNLFLGGVIFSLMYICTKSLWLGISFHFFWNYFLFIFLSSPVSGFSNNIAFADFGITALPGWLFGGNIGVEGGIAASLVLILNAYIIKKYAKPAPEISAAMFKRYYAESAIIYQNDKTKIKSKR